MSLIKYEKTHHIGIITFDNQAELNAMTPSMGDELSALLEQVISDEDLRVVIFTGAGKAFSSGGNLDFILSNVGKPEAQSKQDMLAFYNKYLKLKKIPVPTIAVINGAAVGAGLCIAMACDLRLAASHAKMGVNFAKIGLSSGMGCLYHLTHLVGPAIAAELLFTGKLIEATEAKQIGLVNHSYAAESLMDEAMKLAKTIADNSPVALRIIKQGLQFAPIGTLDELFDYEARGQAISFNAKDLQEGIAAIREKRPAKY